MESGATPISLDSISTLVIAIATVVYTVGTILLWVSTKKTTKLMSAQIQNQINSNHSLSTHYIINRHKEIFFEIIRNKELLKIFAEESNNSQSNSKRAILASILINHAHSIFIDYNNDVANREYMDSFESDFSDLLRLPFIRNRWMEVRDFHPADFRDFVATILR
ncbi:hypothetical protein [uncultured Roseivirga sp.]|uniref:hypothetical protein n=1 Tax=uncultured Roseivirga sp. TaxID=543088 RepID=UPI0030D7743C|tara:strand:- start:68391 stop:68885 length:495 start_codon:yes stop_codon:yes gene_type:complete